MNKKIQLLFLALIAFSITINAQTFEWAKSMGGQNSDGGNSIAVDASGNVYTTGWFRETVDFDPGPGTVNLSAAGALDIFIQKLDKSGTLIWAKAIGGSSVDEGKSIALDASGNIYIGGYFEETADFDPGTGTSNLTSAGSMDIFVLKLDAGGSFIWAKRMGSSGIDKGNSIALDDMGNVFSIGQYEGTVDFDPNAETNNLSAAGNWDAFIQKLDSEGNLLWARGMGGMGFEVGNDIAVDAAGNAYSTGYFDGTADFDPGAGTSFFTSAGIWDIFIQKLDTAGNFLWAKSMGGPDFDEGNSLAVDASGSVFTTGSFGGSVDFDPNAGAMYLNSTVSSDIFIQKLDAGGNFQWAKGIGGTEKEAGTSIALDVLGNIYTTGWFGGTVDFDPNGGTTTLTSQGRDIFIQNLDASGNLLWAKNIGGTDHDYGEAIAVDNSGNVYTTGFFQGTADFDPTAGTSILSSNGNFDIFILKMDAENSVGIEDLFTSKIKLYPNPSSGLFTIELPEGTRAAQINVADNLGKVVFRGELEPGENKLDLSHLPAGIYFVSMMLNTGDAVYGKVILTR